MVRFLFILFVSLSASAGGLAFFLAGRHLFDAYVRWHYGNGTDAMELFGLALVRGAYAVIVLLIGYVVLDVGMLGPPTWRLWAYLAALVAGAVGYLILILTRKRSQDINGREGRRGAGGPGGTGGVGGQGGEGGGTGGVGGQGGEGGEGGEQGRPGKPGKPGGSG